MSTMEPKFSSKYGVNQKVIQVRVGLHGVESYWGGCMVFPTDQKSREIIVPVTIDEKINLALCTRSKWNMCGILSFLS